MACNLSNLWYKLKPTMKTDSLNLHNGFTCTLFYGNAVSILQRKTARLLKIES
jgi:hypothetical protein